MNDDPNAPDLNLDAEAEAPAEAEARSDARQRVEQQLHELVLQLERLEQEKNKLEEEKQALSNQFLRRQADWENFRKRLEREKQEFRQRAEAELLAQILPVLDGFERALAAEAGDSEDYRKGVELIYKQLADVLARAGLEPVVAAGQPFDPLVHHAIERVETTEHPDHTVIAELQRGYTFKQQLVRPALVRVAVHPDSTAKESEDESKPESIN